MLRRVLVSSNNLDDRRALHDALKNEYDVLDVRSAIELYATLRRSSRGLSAILLDMSMPDGGNELTSIQENAIWSLIPVVALTPSDDDKAQEHALEMGAQSAVPKPFNHTVLLHTLRNCIRLRETASIANSVRKDELTGLLNRGAFFKEAEWRISRAEAGYYMLTCIDIDSFKVINDQHGTEVGDEVLIHLAKCIDGFVMQTGGIACRFMADKFALLYPSKWQESQLISETYLAAAAPACLNRRIKLRIGRYLVIEAAIPVSAMLDRAILAETSIRGRYDAYIAVYDEAMRENMLREQQIVSEMYVALREGQFEPWLQPQFNHATGALMGAEALARWRRPEDGSIVSPATFIPVFERNGFIYVLDKYIWEQVSLLLRQRLDEGRARLPISVNISRYDVFAPDFFDVITGLVKTYDIPLDLLRLEITETAFAESTNQVVDSIKRLIEFGFVVEIDDFGSGYSSLNTLKDVPAQVLKLDMRFLQSSDISQRGGNILESVVRMARWLNMNVIAEGVETKSQADYLQSIGCSYLQGFYYAKPMTVEAFESLAEDVVKEYGLNRMETVENLDNNAFWNPNSMDTLIFNSYVGGACILEYSGGMIRTIRANKRFKREFDWLVDDDTPITEITPSRYLDAENLDLLNECIKRAIETNAESVCELMLTAPGTVRVASQGAEGKNALYHRCTLRRIAQADGCYLLYCVVYNITEMRVAEMKQREAECKRLAAAERLTAIMDNMCGGIIATVFKNGVPRTLFTNEQFYRLFGGTQADYEAENRTPYDDIVAEDRANLDADIAKAREKLEPFTPMYQIRRRDGEIRWLQGRLTFVTLPDVEGIVELTVVFDMTDQVEASNREREAVRSERKTMSQLTAIMENINGGVSAVKFNPDGSVAYCFTNDRFFEMFGYSKQEAERLRLHVTTMVFPEDMSRVMTVLRDKVISGNGNATFEYRSRTKDGRIVYSRCSSSRTYIEGVGNDVIISVVSDVTEHHMLESAERAASERIRAIMDNASCGITAVIPCENGNLQYIFANDKYYQLVGYTREEYIRAGMADMALMHPDDLEPIGRQIFTLSKVGQSIDLEFRAKHRDNRWIWIHADISVIRLADIDQPVQLACFYDVSARRETEIRLQNESQATLAVMNGIPGGFVRMQLFEDNTIKLVYVNDGFRQMTGIKRDETKDFLSYDPLASVFPEDRHLVQSAIERMIANGDVQDVRYRLQKTDGGVIWVTSVGQAQTNNAGETYLNIFCMNIRT